jgi:dynein heavy chain
MSTQNALIVSNARRWPLVIDPQAQANKWIRKLEEHSGLVVVTPTDADVMRKIEVAVENGKPVLMEGVGETLDSYLDTVLLRQVRWRASPVAVVFRVPADCTCSAFPPPPPTPSASLSSCPSFACIFIHQVFVKGGVAYMQLGASTVPYHRAFRLYLTTSLDNPHYLPEVSTKVTLLNFIVTPSGLTDQLLGLVVKTERPDLEEEKTRLLVTRATNQRQLREIESSILSIIAAKVWISSYAGLVSQ